MFHRTFSDLLTISWLKQFVFGKIEKMTYGRKPMKTVELILFSFFLIFNSVFIVYVIATGVDWSKIVVPLVIVVACAGFIRSILKERKLPK